MLPTQQGMFSYRQPDTRRGCPAKFKKNTPLVKKSFVLPKTSVVLVHGNLIRNAKGRADLHLLIDGHRRDITLTYSSSRQWNDATVFHQGVLRHGKHSVWLQSPTPNVWGCQQEWGGLDIVVLPAMKGLQIRTVKVSVAQPILVPIIGSFMLFSLPTMPGYPSWLSCQGTSTQYADSDEFQLEGGVPCHRAWKSHSVPKRQSEMTAKHLLPSKRWTLT